MAGPLAAGAAFSVLLAVVTALVLIGWAVSGAGADSRVGDAVHAAALLVCGLHLVPVTVGAATITLLPLGGLLVPVLVLYRAGVHAARSARVERWSDAGLLVGSGAAVYGLLLGVLGGFADVGSASVAPPAAFLAGVVVGALGLGAGVVVASGLGALTVASAPDRVVATVRTALVQGLLLLGAAGAVLSVALLARRDAVIAMTDPLVGGATDLLGLLLLSLMCLPTLLVWTLAYVVGPGFVLGGASVSAFGVGGGLVPPLPPLAAVPPVPPDALALLLLLPVAAGLSGALLARRTDGRYRPGAPDLLAAPLLVGAGAGVLAVLARGSLGDARLAYLGPNPVLVALCTAGLVGAGSALVALLTLVHHPRLAVPVSAVAARRVVVDLRGRAAATGVRPGVWSRVRRHLHVSADDLHRRD